MRNQRPVLLNGWLGIKWNPCLAYLRPLYFQKNRPPSYSRSLMIQHNLTNSKRMILTQLSSGNKRAIVCDGWYGSQDRAAIPSLVLRTLGGIYTPEVVLHLFIKWWDGVSKSDSFIRNTNRELLNLLLSGVAVEWCTLDPNAPRAIDKLMRVCSFDLLYNSQWYNIYIRTRGLRVSICHRTYKSFISLWSLENRAKVSALIHRSLVANSNVWRIFMLEGYHLRSTLVVC